MLQMFHMDVAKLDRGMLHMLQLFQRHVQAYVLSVSDVSGVCFICVFLTHLQIALRTPYEKPGFLDKSKRSDQTLRRAMRCDSPRHDMPPRVAS